MTASDCQLTAHDFQIRQTEESTRTGYLLVVLCFELVKDVEPVLDEVGLGRDLLSESGTDSAAGTAAERLSMVGTMCTQCTRGRDAPTSRAAMFFARSSPALAFFSALPPLLPCGFPAPAPADGAAVLPGDATAGASDGAGSFAEDTGCGAEPAAWLVMVKVRLWVVEVRANNAAEAERRDCTDLWGYLSKMRCTD